MIHEARPENPRGDVGTWQQGEQGEWKTTMRVSGLCEISELCHPYASGDASIRVRLLLSLAVHSSDGGATKMAWNARSELGVFIFAPS